MQLHHSTTERYTILLKKGVGLCNRQLQCIPETFLVYLVILFLLSPCVEILVGPVYIVNVVNYPLNRVPLICTSAQPQ